MWLVSVSVVMSVRLTNVGNEIESTEYFFV
jgi:hypothetical protein